MTTADTSAAPRDGTELNLILRDYLDVARRLQETHETLQHEVQRLRGELATKDRELERRRRLSALGELAAGVAHEVRNPLGAIQLYSGLLRRELVGADAVAPGAAALQLVDKIEAGIAAIDAVVRDTLALAPSRARLNPEALPQVVEQALELAQATLRRQAARVCVEAAPECPRVLADAEGLKRVIMNLVSNAAEAAPGETISVRVETVAPAAASGAAVRVVVRDRGPGLPADLLDRIFDPFFTTKSQGTGLGLTIAHRLIEAHGGTLAARNHPEGGAEFVVTLVAADAARAPGTEVVDGCAA